ncbi:MAG: hypothetical protein QUV05_18385 [Phycisphaerae bacterium]|nr:hypothetical protein [Phycisphaerae bacterium]
MPVRDGFGRVPHQDLSRSQRDACLGQQGVEGPAKAVNVESFVPVILLGNPGRRQVFVEHAPGVARHLQQRSIRRQRHRDGLSYAFSRPLLNGKTLGQFSGQVFRQIGPEQDFRPASRLLIGSRQSNKGAVPLQGRRPDGQRTGFTQAKPGQQQRLVEQPALPALCLKVGNQVRPIFEPFPCPALAVGDVLRGNRLVGPA